MRSDRRLANQRRSVVEVCHTSEDNGRDDYGGRDGRSRDGPRIRTSAAPNQPVPHDGPSRGGNGRRKARIVLRRDMLGWPNPYQSIRRVPAWPELATGCGRSRHDGSRRTTGAPCVLVQATLPGADERGYHRGQWRAPRRGRGPGRRERIESGDGGGVRALKRLGGRFRLRHLDRSCAHQG
ncbi:hypothetical protein BD414DRAFT_134293 [Trametes punicea]|nr:hypothetical protein BD414DRAFT_134293 [Trametes punicea]